MWTFLRVLTATDKYAAFLFMVTALVAGIAGVVAVVLLVGRTPPGRAFWDWIVLRMPLLGGAIRRLALARFARMFSMMYSSGMPMHLGLDRACAAAANMHIVRDLRRGHQRVRDGEELGEAFGACRYVPARMREMLLTGDAAGTYDDTLDHIAEIFEDEAEQVLTNLPKVIAPLALIAIGALVVFLFYTYYLRPYIIDPVNELFPQ